MARLLYLVHRFPYPPNKGDKLRSFHLLKHLSKKHEIFLGTFIDNQEDEAFLPHLSEYCTEIKALHLNPNMAKLRSLNALLSGDPLTIRYFRDPQMQNWVDATLARERIDAVIVFCSGMAQYVINRKRLPLFIDLVDVDSLKWGAYATKQRWFMKWIYAREARLLLNYERQIAAKSTRTFLVSNDEKNLLTKLAPEISLRLETMPNGVDTDYFNPEYRFSNPFTENELPIVFTGTMDYWINIEGAYWFSENVLPLLIKKYPTLKFYIIGRNPSPALKGIISSHVVVTGAVEDVRPYIQHSLVVIAPIRTSRGVQNKVLEAMSMARPIVADLICTRAISKLAGNELLAASTVDEYLNGIIQCLSDSNFSQQMGERARIRVLTDYNWDTNLSCIDAYVDKIESGYEN